jgi:hypothetical protein
MNKDLTSQYMSLLVALILILKCDVEIALLIGQSASLCSDWSHYTNHDEVFYFKVLETRCYLTYTFQLELAAWCALSCLT